MEPIRITKENMNKYTRGMTIRVSLNGHGFMEVTRKSLIEYLELYRDDYDVYYSKTLHKFVYLYTVQRKKQGKVAVDERQLALNI